MKLVLGNVQMGFVVHIILSGSAPRFCLWKQAIGPGIGWIMFSPALEGPSRGGGLVMDYFSCPPRNFSTRYHLLWYKSHKSHISMKRLLPYLCCRTAPICACFSIKCIDTDNFHSSSAPPFVGLGIGSLIQHIYSDCINNQ